VAATNRVHQDFISGTLDATLVLGGLTLSGAALADLVAVADPDFVPIVLDPEAVDGDPEIVWVTAHTALATTATIQREKEGTVDREHLSGTKFIVAVTADAVDEFRSDIEALEAADTAHEAAANPHTLYALDADLASHEADWNAHGSAPVVASGALSNSNVALTTSFVDHASVVFSMPSGWATARISAWGLAGIDWGGGAESNTETRVEIGGTNGTAITKTIFGNSVVPARLLTDVSGDVTIAIANRETSSADMSVDFSIINYIAYRLT
jgi:hypothetical protein